VGDTAPDRRPALQPFNPFFEIAVLERGGVRGRRGPVANGLIAELSGLFAPRASHWATASVRPSRRPPLTAPGGQSGLTSER